MPTITIQQLGLFIGCQTNKGKLVGLTQNKVYIQSKTLEDYELSGAGNSFKLLLKKLNSLSPIESKMLIEKGFSIGRPNGYSFSPEAVLYLASLGVDLFGWIESGYADEMPIANEQQTEVK